MNYPIAQALANASGLVGLQRLHFSGFMADAAAAEALCIALAALTKVTGLVLGHSARVPL